MKPTEPDKMPSEEMTPEYQQCLALVHRLTPESPEPESDPRKQDRIMRRVEAARQVIQRDREIRNARVWNAAIAAGVGGIVSLLTLAAVAPSRPPKDRGGAIPQPPRIVDESPVGDPELVAALADLESDMLLRAVAQVAESNQVPAQGRQAHADAILSRYAFDMGRIRHLKALAGRPSGGSRAEPLGYDEAKLQLVGRLRSRHTAVGRDSARPVLVLNGAPESRVDSYARAQGVIDCLDPMPSARRRRSLDESTRTEILRLISERPDEPWPDAVRKKLAEAVGSASLSPIVIVVNIQFNASDRSGTLEALGVDPDRRDHRLLAETEKFLESHPSIDLFRFFRNPEGPDDVERREDSQGLTLVIKENNRPFTMVSLNAGDEGLPVRDFCPGRLAEVMFEAKATFEGRGRPPAVQFGTGGDEVMASVSPFMDLGPDWQLVTIPVDLTQAERWKTGLTIATHAVPAKTKLTVTIRKAFIRPLGDGRTSAFSAARGGQSAANLPGATIERRPGRSRAGLTSPGKETTLTM